MDRIAGSEGRRSWQSGRGWLRGEHRHDGLSVRPFGNLVLRAGGGWFALGHDFTSDDLTFDLKANLLSVGATLDWHPFSNGFRLSGGGRYHKFDFSGAGNSTTGAFTINGHPYLMATTGPIHASVTSPSTIAPYFG
ncbi:MAG: hypothetical protein E6G95_12580, partial [Alphaproteobacteria bacterium]